MGDVKLRAGHYFLGPIELPGGVTANLCAPESTTPEVFNEAVRSLTEVVRMERPGEFAVRESEPGTTAPPA